MAEGFIEVTKVLSEGWSRGFGTEVAYNRRARRADTLARRIPGPRLRVVCWRVPDWPEIEIDVVPWNPAAEVEALATADVGLTTGRPAAEAGPPV